MKLPDRTSPILDHGSAYLDRTPAMIVSIPPVRMSDTDIYAYANDVWKQGTWWEREAYSALVHGRARMIHGRTDRDVYLVRCWMTDPVGMEAREDGGRDSGNSVMLHFFPRGDDDACLHDHPWDFRTSLLAGGYREHLPPDRWDPRDGLGPAWDERIVDRCAGDTVAHRATDLHCVGAVRPGTWTLVRTSARIREWGFHPPGQPWQPWREYLADRQRAAANLTPTERIERDRVSA